MKQQHASARHAFTADLCAERATYQKLLSLLELEQTYLANGDAESLHAVAREKSDSVLELLRLGERRSDYLRAHALTADRTGMEQWLRDNGGAERDLLHAAWSELIEAAQQARELNEINGALITSRLVHNQQALESLRGILTPARTYGPDGHTESASLASHLGTA